jgi:K+-sensing histidine kinase KdpD
MKQGHQPPNPPLTTEGGEKTVDFLLISLGIPDAVRKIFEPFFTTKPVGKGTGQGRAMSRNVIVKRQGGKLSSKSRSGTGRRFRSGFR